MTLQSLVKILNGESQMDTLENIRCSWLISLPLFMYTMLITSSPRYIHEDEDNDYVMYDLDELDLNWLESVNGKRKFRGA